MKEYDLIIIGSGPAGLTAGIYAARYNLDFLIIGKSNGGAIFEAHKVCNYPTQNNIAGYELTKEIVSHLKDLNGEIKNEEVLEITNNNKNFSVKTNENTYIAKKIILATGREKQKLNLKREDELLGRGLSYCATCDAAFYRGKTVAVVGGGNTAITAALLLAEHAEKIYIIYRGKNFKKAEPEWLRQAEKEKKIEAVFNSEIDEILGEKFVEGIILKDKRKLSVDGVFIEIGFSPEKKFSDMLKIKTHEDYIITDEEKKTSVGGVYAAGDNTNNKLKQVITACAEGAIAATSVYEDLKKEK